jgi:hypothetical protein
MMASNLQRIGLSRRKEIFRDVVRAQDAVAPAYMVCQQLHDAKEHIRGMYGITPAAMEAILTEGVMRDFPPFGD